MRWQRSAVSTFLSGLVVSLGALAGAQAMVEVAFDARFAGLAADAASPGWTVRAQPLRSEATAGEVVPVAAPAGQTRVTVPLPAGGAWRVTGEAPGWWAAPATINVRQGLPPISVAFRPTGRLRGQARFARGVAPATSLEARFAPSPSTTEVEGAVSCAVTDGRFDCEVPVGTMDVRLRLPGCISHYAWGVEVKAGAEVEMGTLLFEPGASLVGWVEAGRGHRLSPGVRVEIAPQADPESAPAASPSRWTALRSTATVNERGFFHFQGVAPGTYRLIATQPDGPPSRPFAVTVVEGSEVTLERPLLLDTWASVELQLVPARSPEGEPWRLELRDVDLGRGVFETVARTIVDEGGRARFERLTPGEFTLRVSGSSSETVHSAPLVVEPGDGFHEVRLGLVEVRGSVTLGKEPLAATVWFGGQQGSVRVKATADEKGKFVTFLPRPGEWIVEVIGEGVGVRRRFQAVDVGGGTSRPRTVDLVIPATWIRGEVVQENGARATGALVTVTGQGGFEQTVQLRAEGGEFEVWGLDPGPVMIRAQERDADSDWVSRVLRDDGSPVEVRLSLRRKTTLAGRLVTAGRPVPGAALVAWSTSAPAVIPDAMAMSGVDGGFELRLPAAATEVMLTVEAAGFARRLLRLPVQGKGEAIELPVIPGGGTLVVQFARPPELQDPIFSGYLVVHNGAVEDYYGLEVWARRHGAAVDGAARVTIPALEDGSYTLCRGGAGEYAALVAGSVLPDRCRSVFLPPGGEATLAMP